MRFTGRLHCIVARNLLALGGAQIARLGAGFGCSDRHGPVAGAHARAAHLKAAGTQFQALRILLLSVGEMLGAVPNVLGT